MPIDTSTPAYYIIHNTEPLDETDPNARDLLEKLQGNILKGHGRDFGVYIFFRFRDDRNASKKQLGQLARYVTSAYRQYQEAAAFRKFKVPGDLFGSLVLSASGYRYLGFDADTAFPEEGEPEVKCSFVEGMKEHAAEDFCDRAVSEWDSPYQGDIHGMLLLADHDEDHLFREAGRAIQELGRHHDVVGVELGKALRDAEGNGMEHFGFADGRSQPLFLKSDFRYDAGKRASDSQGGAIDVWDPFEPLKRILVPDPMVDGDAHSYGSFLVFRKLEQDVQSFHRRERELADHLRLQGVERARAGAMAVGRFRNGTPLALSETGTLVPEQANNFAYNGDAVQPNSDGQGLKCPLQAHIRKVNPRGDIASDASGSAQIERQRRIARRGIPYDEREKFPGTPATADDPPSHGVGMLFMCFQASIRLQFAYLQKQWCNSVARRMETGGVRPTGVDPVVGQANGNAQAQAWPLGQDQPSNGTFSFQGFVRMKGGEFFFAPSIPFFDKLKE